MSTTADPFAGKTDENSTKGRSRPQNRNYDLMTASTRRRAKIKLQQKIPHTAWRITKGDLVEIIDGRTDLGAQGIVKKVIRQQNKVIVNGLSLRKRQYPCGQSETTGAIEVGYYEYAPSPIHVSNLALVDPMDQKPCKVKMDYTAAGEKVRVSRRTGAILPLPERDPIQYKSNPTTDTPTAHVDAVTYKAPSYNRLLPFIARRWQEAIKTADQVNKEKDATNPLRHVKFRRVKGRKVLIPKRRVAPVIKFTDSRDDRLVPGFEYYQKY